MFAIKRNQVIITALVIMIAVAGYLNYIDSTTFQPNQMILNDEGEIAALIPNKSENDFYVSYGDIGAALVFDDNPTIDVSAQDTITTTDLTNEAVQTGSDTLPESSNVTEPGEAIFVSTTMGSSYFVQAKLEREQSRAIQKDYILEVINNTNIAQEKRADFADEMLAIQKRIEKESAAEALLEAKGFKDVYVRIDDNTVDVIVNKEILSDAEIAQIEDAVKRKTGMTSEQIRISPMKK